MSSPKPNRTRDYDASWDRHLNRFVCRWCEREDPSREEMVLHLRAMHSIQEPRFWE